MFVNIDVREQQGMDFSPEKALWIMDCILARRDDLKLNALMYLFLKNTQLFTSYYINYWTGVWIIGYGGFYHLFGHSFWRHPFTLDDPLVSKWCNA